MDKPLRVLFAGTPDAGKSTLIGRILLMTGSVMLDQYQDDLAFYTDGLDGEQSKGMTIDVAYKTIHLSNGRRCILIDTPGHSELLSNFISAASYADIILYLKDSTRPQLNSIHPELSHRMNVPMYTVSTKVLSANSHDIIADFYVDSSGAGVDTVLKFLETYNL